MNGRRLILLSLLAVAAYLALFGDNTPYDTPSADVVQSVSTRGTAGSRPAEDTRALAEGRLAVSRPLVGNATSTLEVVALIPRAKLIPATIQDQEGRDLFPSLSWTPLPPKPETPSKPPPPMAPPIPYVHLGKKQESGQWEAYLGRGEEVFIVREGMTLEGLYWVKTINPPTLTLVYLPLKQLQTISIGGTQ